MESLHKRLDHQRDAVLRVTEMFGPWRAMEVYSISDYLCFARWLQEVTGDVHFGLTPKIRLDGHQSLGDQIVAAFVRTVLNLQAQVEQQREEIAYLKEQLASGTSKEQLQAMAVLQMCDS